MQMVGRAKLRRAHEAAERASYSADGRVLAKSRRRSRRWRCPALMTARQGRCASAHLLHGRCAACCGGFNSQIAVWPATLSAASGRRQQV